MWKDGARRGGETIQPDSAAAREICLRTALGEPLPHICRSRHLPRTRTVLGWLSANQSFRQRYRRALALQLNLLGEDVLELADGCTEHSEDVRRRARGIEARKEHAERALARLQLLGAGDAE